MSILTEQAQETQAKEDWVGSSEIMMQNGLWGYTQAISHTTPIEYEFRALKRGLQIVINHQLAPLEINTDAKDIIRMLQTSNLKYDALICDCRA